MFACAIRNCKTPIPHVVRYVPLPPDGQKLLATTVCDLEALRQHLLEAHGTRPAEQLLPRFHRVAS